MRRRAELESFGHPRNNVVRLMVAVAKLENDGAVLLR